MGGGAPTPTVDPMSVSAFWPGSVCGIGTVNTSRSRGCGWGLEWEGGERREEKGGKGEKLRRTRGLGTGGGAGTAPGIIPLVCACIGGSHVAIRPDVPSRARLFCENAKCVVASTGRAQSAHSGVIPIVRRPFYV